MAPESDLSPLPSAARDLPSKRRASHAIAANTDRNTINPALLGEPRQVRDRLGPARDRRRPGDLRSPTPSAAPPANGTGGPVGRKRRCSPGNPRPARQRASGRAQSRSGGALDLRPQPAHRAEPSLCGGAPALEIGGIGRGRNRPPGDGAQAKAAVSKAGGGLRNVSD